MAHVLVGLGPESDAGEDFGRHIQAVDHRQGSRILDDGAGAFLVAPHERIHAAVHEHDRVDAVVPNQPLVSGPELAGTFLAEDIDGPSQPGRKFALRVVSGECGPYIEPVFLNQGIKRGRRASSILRSTSVYFL